MRRVAKKQLMDLGYEVVEADTAMRLGEELGLSMAGALDKPVRLAELRDA